MEGKSEHFGGRPKLERRIVPEQLARRDRRSVFTQTQHDFMALYRDGATEESLELLGFGAAARKDLWEDILARYRGAFVRNPGRSKSFAALGVAITAGWIDARDFSRLPTSNENALGNLMINGFSVEQAARTLDQEIKGTRIQMDNVKAELGIHTDYELVAWFASSKRKNKLNKNK